jgi:hypothetical protein
LDHTGQIVIVRSNQGSSQGSPALMIIRSVDTIIIVQTIVIVIVIQMTLFL